MTNLKFYGQFTPPVDKFIYDRYFYRSKYRGAFDGLTECSCKFFEESLGWSGFNIEPLPWIYEQLCKNRPLSTNLNFALSDNCDNATFHAVDHPQFGLNCTNGSLNHCESHKKILEEMQVKMQEVEVKCITWNEFIKQQQIKHIDLLVLDIEGHETTVLQTIDKNSVLPDLICVEVGHTSLAPVSEILAKLGYGYDTTQDVNAYFIKNEKQFQYQLKKYQSFVRKAMDVLPKRVWNKFKRIATRTT